MAWKRLDHSKLKNIGGSNKNSCVLVYGQEGKHWPRLVISINSTVERYLPEKSLGPDFTISCSEKESAGAWWGTVPIPKELIGDLIELLNRFKESPDGSVRR